MEYLNGGSLKSFLDSLETKVDEFTALQMIRQLTAALQYLHEQNLTHGDLHDENIMLHVENNKTVAKIVDLGSCKQLETRNKMRDITNLALHLIKVLDKSQFVRTHIEAYVRGVLNMMSNSVYTDMNQVVKNLSGFLPASDVPAPPRSILSKFTKLFSKNWINV